MSAVVRAVALLAVASCAPSRRGPAPACEPDPPFAPAALVELARASANDGVVPLGHLRELALGEEGTFFVADASGVPAYRLSEGRLERLRGVVPEERIHCSSIALHAPSRTLVCTAADSGLVGTIDVRDPSRPSLTPWPPEQLPPVALPSVPDVAVHGDVAWLAANHAGLLRAPLGSDGRPLALEDTGLGSRVVQVAFAGERLVMLDRDEGLVVLDPASGAELARAALPGPAIDLATDGDRLAISLGSEGVLVLELDGSGAPRTLAHVQPQCVATGAALREDELAVACLSGVSLYALEAGGARLAGAVPATYGVLDVAYHGEDLVVVDWYDVAVFATDLGGVVAQADAPRYVRVAPGSGARVPIRNPGATPLALEWSLGEDRRGAIGGRTTLAAGATEIFELSAEELAAAGVERGVELVVRRPDGCTPGTRTLIATRASDEPPDRGRASIGDRFPTLARSSPGPGPDLVPPTGAPGLVVFLTVDCYLQWPQLEDLAWSRAHGGDVAEPTIFFLTTVDEDPFDHAVHMSAFDAERLLMVEWADFLGSVPGAGAHGSPVRAFEETFMMRDAPGADFPHDYHLDADGTITATSRLYRGRWPLGE